MRTGFLSVGIKLQYPSTHLGNQGETECLFLPLKKRFLPQWRRISGDPGLTMHFGPNEILLNLEVQFKGDLPVGEIAPIIDRLERTIREHHPEIRRIFIEAETPPPHRFAPGSIEPEKGEEPGSVLHASSSTLFSNDGMKTVMKKMDQIPSIPGHFLNPDSVRVRNGDPLRRA